MRLLLIWAVGTSFILAMTGCKPDSFEVDIYTSDIEAASGSELLMVPATVTFKLMGKDEQGLLPKSKAVAKKYLGDNAEFKMSKGNIGDIMVAKCELPMGTQATIQEYLAKNRIPAAVLINAGQVTLVSTPHLKTLNDELSDVNMMLSLDLPAGSTRLRLVGDMRDAPTVIAIAVFVDNKAELLFKRKIERRKNVELEFKGGDDSIYSQVPVQFGIEF